MTTKRIRNLVHRAYAKGDVGDWWAKVYRLASRGHRVKSEARRYPRHDKRMTIGGGDNAAR